MRSTLASGPSPLLQLRDMQQQDLPQVLAIERASYHYPWSRRVFEDCLANAYICWLAEHEARPTAYLIGSIVLDEAHLLNLCVTPKLRQQGIGQWLLNELARHVKKCGAQTLFLEVRPSNRVASKLYQNEGFCEVGLRRGYYPTAKGYEDALIMAKPLTGAR